MTRATYPDLAGKSIAITGGATGIGAALVRAFSGQGAVVHFADLQVNAGQTLASETGAHFTNLDITDHAAISAWVESAAPDVLINNAANDTRADPLNMSPDAWRAALAVNLDGTFYAAQSAIKHMRSKGGGAIINFASINAHFGPENMAGYIAAKGAVLSLSKALAQQYGRDNIRVNTLTPGWVITSRQKELWYTAEAAKDWKRQVALQDDILPEHVADLALFLASEDSCMITGQEIIIDAGRL